jgi:hypothetical protein
MISATISSEEVAVERWSTLSLLDKYPDNIDAAERVLSAAADYLYNLGDWEGVEVLDALRPLVLGEPVAEPCLYWVGVYLEDRAFGGREEGGWWYDYGNLQTAAWIYKECGAFPSCHSSHAAARRARDRMASGLEQMNRERRSDIGSVLSEGRYTALIFEDVLPASYPDNKPRYE